MGANSVDQDQTDPKGAFWSESTNIFEGGSKANQQTSNSRQLFVIVVIYLFQENYSAWLLVK